MTQHKRLFNRYDPYEINSIFSETAEEYLGKKGKVARGRFIIKALLGILLFINGYLSHWGPWPWPTNYYLIAFSVVFYHIASFFYEKVSGIPQTQGRFIGDFSFGPKIFSFLMKMCDDRNKYYLQAELKGSSSEKKSKELVYYQYFTEEGYFLEQKFKNDIDKLVGELQK